MPSIIDVRDGVAELLLCWPIETEQRSAHRKVFSNPIFSNPVVVLRSMVFPATQRTNGVEHVSCHEETLVCSGIAEKLIGQCAISGAARADLSYGQSGAGPARFT